MLCKIMRIYKKTAKIYQFQSVFSHFTPFKQYFKTHAYGHEMDYTNQ